jgi:hypothetical protein
MRLVVGILAGVAAIAVVRVTNVTMDSLLGITTVLATGNVVGAIVGSIAGMSRKAV